MIGTWKRRIGLLGLGWALGMPASASAQFVPMPATPTGNATTPSAAVMANPYLNPYLNPYINPAATQRSMTPGNAAIYMYQANAMRGGIGSGIISQGKAQSPRSRPAVMPDSISVPGGGAAKYFNPPGPAKANGPGSGTAGGGAGRFYNTRKAYFNNNGGH